MLRDLVLKNRSYRRFKEDESVSEDLLRELVDLARLTPSARNAQPLKYFLANTSEVNDRIFPHLAWAGYLKEWAGPDKGERPSAYIIVLNDSEIAANYFCDDGIATQTILLGAVENGYGGCIIGSVDRLRLQRELGIANKYKIVHVIALGIPKEDVKLTEIEDGDYKYWRDLNSIHHVPKRSLDDIII